MKAGLDTILITLFIKDSTGENYIEVGMKKVKECLEKLRYCSNVEEKTIEKEDSNIKKINCILSYPRFYAKTNAHLIEKKEECIKVHREFIRKIESTIDEIPNEEMRYIHKKNFKENLKIKITRVDIPFTFDLEDQVFKQQLGLLKFLKEVYNEKVNRGTAVIISKENIESLIMADSKNIKAYNKKITIYDQEKKFKDIYGHNPKVIERILKENQNLKNRLRIEVSKKINRGEFSLSKFKKFDIYSTYVISYAKYLLETLFDENLIQEILNRRQHELEIKIDGMDCNKYQVFILENLEIIVDYTLVRKALMNAIENQNTAYKACEVTRKILKEISTRQEIEYFNVLDKIKKIRKELKKIIKKGVKVNE